jgi:ribosomal protein L44E
MYEGNPQTFSEWKQLTNKGYDVKVSTGNDSWVKIECKFTSKPVFYSWVQRDWSSRLCDVIVTNNKWNVPYEGRQEIKRMGIKLLDTCELIPYLMNLLSHGNKRSLNIYSVYCSKFSSVWVQEAKQVPKQGFAERFKKKIKEIGDISSGYAERFRKQLKKLMLNTSTKVKDCFSGKSHVQFNTSSYNPLQRVKHILKQALNLLVSVTAFSVVFTDEPVITVPVSLDVNQQQSSLVPTECAWCHQVFMLPNGCYSPEARKYVVFCCWDCIKSGGAEKIGFSKKLKKRPIVELPNSECLPAEPSWITQRDCLLIGKKKSVCHKEVQVTATQHYQRLLEKECEYL